MGASRSKYTINPYFRLYRLYTCIKETTYLTKIHTWLIALVCKAGHNSLCTSYAHYSYLLTNDIACKNWISITKVILFDTS